MSLTSPASAAPLTDEDRRVLALLPTHMKISMSWKDKARVRAYCR